MKIQLLALALTSAVAFTACSNDQAGYDDDAMTPPAASTMPDDTLPPPEPAPMTTDDAMATDNPMVGGAAMSADRDIIANASESNEHTTLVAAITAAELVETLQGPGPFTVFAPTDAAFEALPEGTVDGLLEPDSQDELAALLTYHVVSGNLDAAALTEQIEAGDGNATLTTVEGGTLTVEAAAGGVTVTDAQGNVANVTTADVMQSNGVIHVVDTVLMP